MPLLTVVNLRTSSIAFQTDGLAFIAFTVPGSTTVTDKVVSEAQLAALEAQLVASAAASHITWTTKDNPGSQADDASEGVVTVLLTPHNAAAGSTSLVTDLTTPGAVSVVLPVAAPIGRRVQVVDGKGDAGANNVTITVASAGTINGGANLIINANKGTAWLQKTGATEWKGYLAPAITTAAAGGDLAGNFPNPTIGALKVLETMLVGTVRSAPQALSGPGAINVTTRTTLFTSTGVADALTLANGTRVGQLKTVIHTVDGGSGVITCASAGNHTTVTLTNRWESVTFQWSGSVWDVISASPVAIVA